MFMEDPVMKKALLFYVLDGSGCDLKPGTIPGLGGPTRMVCSATINKWPWVFTSKSMTHCTQTALSEVVLAHSSLGPALGTVPSRQLAV